MNELDAGMHIETVLKSSLAESLRMMEKGQSPFEKAIRTIEVPVCSAFTSSGSVAPIMFRPGEGILEPNSEIADFFPNSIAASKNRILTAGDPMTTKVSGKRVAVLFSGGPAAGGHNVVAGLKQILGPEN